MSFLVGARLKLRRELLSKAMQDFVSWLEYRKSSYLCLPSNKRPPSNSAPTISQNLELLSLCRALWRILRAKLDNLTG